MTANAVPNPHRLRLLFVGGCDRSGTTLLAGLLGTRRGAVVIPEAQFIVEYLASSKGAWDGSRFLAFMRRHPRFALWGLPLTSGLQRAIGEAVTPSAAVATLAMARHALVFGDDLGEEPLVVIDQTPWSIAHSDVLLNAFPSAHFVEIIRDGRAVFASTKRLPWGPNTAYHAALFWQMRILHGIAARRGHPRAITTVKYEDVIADPTEALCSLSFQLALNPSDDGTELRPEFEFAPGANLYHPRLHLGVDSTRIDAWRSELSPRAIERFEYWAGPTLTALGYPLIHAGFAQPPGQLERFAEGTREFARFYLFNPPRQYRRLRAGRRQAMRSRERRRADRAAMPSPSPVGPSHGL